MTDKYVRFLDPSPAEQEAVDKGMRMRVVWVDAPRICVAVEGTGLTITPTKVLNLEDVIEEE